MLTFKQYLAEANAKGVVAVSKDNKKKVAPFMITTALGEAASRKDKKSHYNEYDKWKADAHKLGYTLTHHTGAEPPKDSGWIQAKWTTAHKVNKKPSSSFQTHRGSFSHQGHGRPFGHLRYKYMPEMRVMKPTIQPKHIKTKGAKPVKPIQPIKPEQSNIKNMLTALAQQPTGHKSSISTGETV